MTEGLNLKATARVKITKLDEHNNVVCIEEHTTELTKEEVEQLWHSQMQE